MSRIRSSTIISAAASALLLLPVLTACTAPNRVVEEGPPQYDAPLPPGMPALREVTDADTVRRLYTESFDPNDALLIEAMRRSVDWYQKPSAKTYFPVAGVSYERARASTEAMLALLERHPSREEFINEATTRFNVFESVGWNGKGTVLFTGYYAGEFKAAETATSTFKFPLYRRPADLATEPGTGRPLGRWVGSASADPSAGSSAATEPYPTRREIEKSGMLAGSELYWLSSPLDVYTIHINGSARLRLSDGSVRYVGYAGKTDRPYQGLGRTMLDRHLISPDQLSLPGIRQYFKQHPDQMMDLIYENQNYVFFTEYPSGQWPAGSLGVRVTEKRSLATDKSIFPRGSVVIADTRIPTYAGATRPFVRMMLDQDTGGAIQAPGRADLYMGEGEAAGLLAGRQYQEGCLYYLFLRE